MIHLEPCCPESKTTEYQPPSPIVAKNNMNRHPTLLLTHYPNASASLNHQMSTSYSPPIFNPTESAAYTNTAITLHSYPANPIHSCTDITNDELPFDPLTFDEVKKEIDEIDLDLTTAMLRDTSSISTQLNPNAFHMEGPSATPLAKKKKKKKKPRKHNKFPEIGYDPNPMKRAQGNIQVSKSLTESIVPRQIKESLCNVYAYMDKSYALSSTDANLNITANDPRIKIINYDFHDRMTNDLLYCVIVRQDVLANKSRGYHWRMVNRLFTSNDLYKEYGIAQQQLPTTWRATPRYRYALKEGFRIEKILLDERQRKEIITACAWHKIDVFNRVNNKRRMTLSLTKPEFMKQCRMFSKDLHSTRLIPIVMFNQESNEAWIEHVWIVRIDGDIDVGISFKFSPQGELRVSGLHLDREFLMNQHELVLQEHDCHCFDTFQSNISDLRIGNPDDLQNKINYYRQVIDELSNYKDLCKEFMSIEVSQTNLYRIQLLQDRLNKGSDTASTENPSINLNANYYSLNQQHSYSPPHEDGGHRPQSIRSNQF